MQAALNVNSNITIHCLDKYGNITRTSNIHNKATVGMVEGLLRFLCGEFNRTKFNQEEEYVTNNEADMYIPSELRVGMVGVEMRDVDGIPYLGVENNLNNEDYKYTAISYGEQKKPTFDDTRLQEEIPYEEVSGNTLNFDSIELTTFDDPNNSMGLLLRRFIPAGKLVGYGSGESRKYFTDELAGEGRGWVYYNPQTDEYETMITEMGLYSGQGNLLARVLFDGKVDVTDDGEVVYDIDGASNNPIIQSDTSSLVIEWRIGIISIGQNDDISSAARPDIEVVVDMDYIDKIIKLIQG